MAEALARQRLATAPIFEGFTDAQRDEIVQIAREETYGPGDVVIREGDPQQILYILYQGTVEVVKRRPPLAARGGWRHPRNGADVMVLATLIPPLVFGEMSFFRPAPHSATVRCVTPVRVLRIDRSAYDELVHRGSLAPYKLAVNLNKVLADRLANMDERIAGMITDSDDHRQMEEWTEFRSKLYQDWNI